MKHLVGPLTLNRMPSSPASCAIALRRGLRLFLALRFTFAFTAAFCGMLLILALLTALA